MKNKLLGKLAVGLLICGMSVSLCACGSSSTSNDTETESKEENNASLEGAYFGYLGSDIYGDDLTVDKMSFSFVAEYMGGDPEGKDAGYNLALHYRPDMGAENGAINFEGKDCTENSAFDDIEDETWVDVKATLIAKHESDDYEVPRYQVEITEVNVLDKNDYLVKKYQGRHYFVGDYVEFASGLKITVTGTGIASEGGDNYAYVDIDAENIGDDTFTFGFYEVDFYGDDYNIGYTTGIGGKTFNQTEIAPGRKASGRCFSGELEKDYSVIEAQLGDAIIVIKCPGMEETSSSESDENSNISSDSKTSSEAGDNSIIYGSFSTSYNGMYTMTIDQYSEDGTEIIGKATIYFKGQYYDEGTVVENGTDDLGNKEYAIYSSDRTVYLATFSTNEDNQVEMYLTDSFGDEMDTLLKDQ